MKQETCQVSPQVCPQGSVLSGLSSNFRKVSPQVSEFSFSNDHTLRVTGRRSGEKEVGGRREGGREGGRDGGRDKGRQEERGREVGGVGVLVCVCACV